MRRTLVQKVILIIFKNTIMTKETEYATDMIDMFSDNPFATENNDETYTISYDALSCFFRHQHRIFNDGGFDMYHSEPNDKRSVARKA